MADLKLGHLAKDQASLISSIPVKDGQVIYSEGHNMQFVDYLNKRHTYGSVISGIYNDSGYVDFNGLDLPSILTTIKLNGNMNDGQLITADNSIYIYKNINDKNLLIKINDTENLVNANDIGYAIHLSEYTDGDSVDMDVLISIYNEVHGDRLFLIKVEDSTINYAKCEDLNGVFDQANLDLLLTNVNGLFTFTLTQNSKFKVVSYSISSSGSSTNDGFYVAAND